MMAAALPVDEDSVDVAAIVQRMKQGIPPADVQEYLWRVRIEAEGIPDVVVSDVDPRKYDAKQTPNMPALEELQEVSRPALLPSDAWKADLLAEFADLRQLLSRWREIGPPKRNEPPSSILRTQVPRMNDQDAWRVFFFGKPGGDQQSTTVSDDEEEPKLPVLGTPPHLRLLLQFDQVLTRRLLVYHTEWLQSLQELSRARAVWIYALLARLDKPVHAEVAATIRQLLRRCWSMRNQLNNPVEEQLKALNVIICITGEFFGQLE